MQSFSSFDSEWFTLAGVTPGMPLNVHVAGFENSDASQIGQVVGAVLEDKGFAGTIRDDMTRPNGGTTK